LVLKNFKTKKTKSLFYEKMHIGIIIIIKKLQKLNK